MAHIEKIEKLKLKILSTLYSIFFSEINVLLKNLNTIVTIFQKKTRKRYAGSSESEDLCVECIVHTTEDDCDGASDSEPGKQRSIQVC